MAGESRMKRTLHRASISTKKLKREHSALLSRRDEIQAAGKALAQDYGGFEDFDPLYDLPALDNPETDMHQDVLCGSERCDPCFKKSIASNRRVASFLASNPSSNAFEVPLLAHDIYKWQCFECEHTFSATCFSVSLGVWCPKCADRMYA
jgi:hypothetical protein